MIAETSRPHRVALFITCLGDLFYPQVGEATVRLLRRAGLTVGFPRRQTCCGQPAYNSGFHHVTRQLAEHFVNVFDNAEYIVTPFGSCAALVKNEYPHLFDDDPKLRERVEALGRRTYELTSFLVDVLGMDDFGATFAARATYHDGCHAYRGLGIYDAPRRLLAHVRGLDLFEMGSPVWCCGFGGTFSVRMPDTSGAILEEKIRRIQATGADVVVSTEFGCMMNIAGGLARRRLPLRVIHLASILAGDVR